MSDPAQHPRPMWERWTDWSMITASNHPGFTLWLTGLPGTGKRTLAQTVRQVLQARGYRTEVIDHRMLAPYFLQEPGIHPEPPPNVSLRSASADDNDTLLMFLCTLLTRNDIIAIATSTILDRRGHSRMHEQIDHLIQVHLHCSLQQRRARLLQRGASPTLPVERPETPSSLAELHIDTTSEFPERSTLRIVSYLEHNGYIAPLWETPDSEDEEISAIKARLQALGYLE